MVSVDSFFEFIVENLRYENHAYGVKIRTSGKEWAVTLLRPLGDDPRTGESFIDLCNQISQDYGFTNKDLTSLVSSEILLSTVAAVCVVYRGEVEVVRHEHGWDVDLGPSGLFYGNTLKDALLQVNRQIDKDVG